MVRGRRMSWAGRIVVLALAVLTVFLGAGRASAVHQNGLFELDGDAFNDPALPGDDWSSVNLGLPGGYFSHVFVPYSVEGPAVDKTFFTGGGSKDTNDLSQWGWSANDVAPDKDQLTEYLRGFLRRRGRSHDRQLRRGPVRHERRRERGLLVLPEPRQPERERLVQRPAFRRRRLRRQRLHERRQRPEHRRLQVAGRRARETDERPDLHSRRHRLRLREQRPDPGQLVLPGQGRRPGKHSACLRILRRRHRPEFALFRWQDPVLLELPRRDAVVSGAERAAEGSGDRRSGQLRHDHDPQVRDPEVGAELRLLRERRRFEGVGLLARRQRRQRRQHQDVRVDQRRRVQRLREPAAGRLGLRPHLVLDHGQRHDGDAVRPLPLDQPRCGRQRRLHVLQRSQAVADGDEERRARVRHRVVRPADRRADEGDRRERHDDRSRARRRRRAHRVRDRRERHRPRQLLGRLRRRL